MSNLDKYNEIFCEVFTVNQEALHDEFSKESVEKWDSVLQLSLVTHIEDAFDIMFEPEDIMDFTSYKKGKEILSKNGIEI
jgi:acyl carrier protein